MDSKVKPKEKRRNSEKRKEKSRDAARCRRSKESEIFHDMASLLPLPASTVTSLDKASVMRLAISFLKTKHILKMIPAAAAASSSRSLVSSDYSSRDCSVSPVSSVSSDSGVRGVSGRDRVVSGTLSGDSVTCEQPFSVASGSAVPRDASVSLEDGLYLKALDGFVLVLSTEGDLVFLSENVNHHLGLSQTDLMGQSIYDVTHPCDHSEVKSILSTKDVHTKRSMFIRFKCTLTSKGRNVNVKAASYKVIHCTGHLVRNEAPAGLQPSSTDADIHDSNNNKAYGTENKENSLDSDSEDMDDDEGDSSGGVEKSHGAGEPPSHCFVAIGEPIPHPSNYDVPLSQTFLTKHSLDMKFTYADETMEDYLGFNPDIFISKSVFEFHHAQDSFHVQNAFKSLFAKGQCQTDRYRFLACDGGYVWVLTQATLIYSKCQKAQSVVCVNFVISGIEEPDQIFSLCQLNQKSSSSVAKKLPQVSPVKPLPTHNIAPKAIVSGVPAKPSVLTRVPTKPTVVPVARTKPVGAVTGKPKPVGAVTGLPKPVVTVPALQKPAVAGAPPAARSATSAVFAPATSTARIVASKPAADEVPISFLTAPLEEILPLPEGITIPKITPFGGSLGTPLPVQNKAQESNQFAPQSAQNSNIKPAPLGVQNENIIKPAVAAAKPVSDPNSVASKFFASYLQEDNPLVRALVAENNAVLAQEAPRPQAATAKIFAPRTEDMNKGYLTFTDDNTGVTMLKDDPEDLTHLAPTAGDACIPLEDSNEFGLMGDLLNEFILPEDNYCPLLSDACDSNSKQMSSCEDDAFYTYRDDSSLSPDHSPGQCSLPSLSSMEDSPPMVEDSMNSLWGLELVDSSSEELCVRAPYIPMPHDDLPLLTAGDLMWGAGGIHKPAPLHSQDPLLSAHSKTMSWSKCNSNSQPKHHQTSNSSTSHHQHQSSTSSQQRGAGLTSSLAKLLKTEPSSNNYEDAGGGGGCASQTQQHTKYNKYSSKKGSNTSSLSPTVLEKKSPASNKRSATPPEWDHRGYWKRSRTPSTTARSLEAQSQSARHNSVLMNLLVSGCDKPPVKSDQTIVDRAEVAKRIRLKSLTAMMDTDEINAEFGDLTTQDFEVNAPTSSLLLGEELLSALECYKA